MQNKKKKRFVPKKKQETCLIWSFLAKMERWQDITSLSWVLLMLEIKHHKAMIAHLSCLSRSVDPLVDQQQLWHCHEELLVLEREEDRHWLVAALWKSRLRLCTAWTLQEPNWINRSPNPAHPLTRSLQDHPISLKLCHISNFLLGSTLPLESLKTLKIQCADSVYDFFTFIRQCTMVSKYPTVCTIWSQMCNK